jgi:predicted Zn-dependent protease
MPRRFIAFALALLGAAGATFAHGDLHEAIDAVSQVIAQSPGDAGLFLRRAELRRMHEDWPAAEADYAKARSLQPDLDAVTFGLAQMRLAQGRENDAMKLLDSL